MKIGLRVPTGERSKEDVLLNPFSFEHHPNLTVNTHHKNKKSLAPQNLGNFT